MRSTSKALYFAAALMVLSISAAASVVINEIELNPPEGGADWVEIYNPDNGSVDISGWTAEITDGSWVGKLSAVPAGTILPARGFYVFNGQSSWNHNDGGYATLYSASGEAMDKTANRQDTMNNDFT
ncbi:MAG: lamin tail domain-containing protein, partial [Methanothrix sp.]|nr:lamin tail domain-containing protein [Methanothrix sp.]